MFGGDDSSSDDDSSSSNSDSDNSWFNRIDDIVFLLPFILTINLIIILYLEILYLFYKNFKKIQELK